MHALSWELTRQYKAQPSSIPLLDHGTWLSWMHHEIQMECDLPTLSALFDTAVLQQPSFSMHFLYATHLFQSVRSYYDTLSQDQHAASQLLPSKDWPALCVNRITLSVELHGSHFSKGFQLWDLLIQLHQLIQSPPDIIHHLYLKLIAIPSTDLESIYSSFQAYIIKHPITTVTPNSDQPTQADLFESALQRTAEPYTTAHNMSHHWSITYEPFVFGNDTGDDTLSLFHHYLSEITEFNPSHVLGFMERSVYEIKDDLRSAIWDIFLTLAKQEPIVSESAIIMLVNRAILNSPRSATFHMHKIRLADSVESLVATLDAATPQLHSVQDFDAVLVHACMWMSRITGKRHDHVVNLLKQGLDVRQRQFPHPNPQFTLIPILVQFGVLANDPLLVDMGVHGLTEGHGCPTAHVWVDVIRHLGSDPRVPELWKFAVAHVTDNPRHVVAEWLYWACTHVEDVKVVEQAHSQLVAIDTYYSSFQDSTSIDEPSNLLTEARKRSIAEVPRTRTQNRQHAKMHLKKKPKVVPEPSPVPPQHLENDAAKMEKLNRTIVVKHVSPTQEHAIRALFETIGEIKDLRFLNPLPGNDNTQAFIQFKNQSSVMDVFGEFRKELVMGHRPLVVEMAQGASFDPKAELNLIMDKKILETQERKAQLHAKQQVHDASGANLFIAGLHKDASITDVRDFLNLDGNGVVDVQLMVNKNGVSKGFGYVLMQSPQLAQSAVAKFNGLFIAGYPEHPIKVAISDPTLRKKPVQPEKVPHTAPQKRNAKSQIYLENLNYATTENALQSALMAYGPVLGVKIPKNQRGQSRGIAFATYATESDASVAVSKLDGAEVGGRRVHAKLVADNKKGRGPANHNNNKVQHHGGQSSNPAVASVLVHHVPVAAKVNWESILPSRLAFEEIVRADGLRELVFQTQVDSGIAVLKLNGHVLNEQVTLRAMHADLDPSKRANFEAANQMDLD